MKKQTLTRLPAALVALTAAASLAHTTAARAEDEVPSNTVRAGLYQLLYHVKADDFHGPFVPAGANIDLKDARTAYFAYLRRINSYLDVEFAFGIPPKTKTEGKGPATLGSVPYNGQVIATAKWLAPTVLLEYKFLPESSHWRPYIGVGVNYTTFYDRQVTYAGQQATGGPSRLSLTSSVGPAGTAGLKYQMDRHWSFNASWSISRVNSDLKVETAGEVRTAHVKFGPQAVVVAAGYSF
jgi:outer membrane protein